MFLRVAIGPEWRSVPDAHCGGLSVSTLARERGMHRFKSIKQAQRFLGSHAAVYNLFNLHRHSLSRRFFKLFRLRSFATWGAVTGT
jgi:hypothetical protein